MSSAAAVQHNAPRRLSYSDLLDDLERRCINDGYIVGRAICAVEPLPIARQRNSPGTRPDLNFGDQLRAALERYNRDRAAAPGADKEALVRRIQDHAHGPGFCP